MLGRDRNVWFAEAAGNKLGRITVAGRITEFAIPTAASKPYGLVVGPDGKLWFTEYGGNKIGRLSL